MRRRAVWLILLMVAVVAVGLWVTTPREIDTKAQMESVLTALRQYHDTHGVLPLAIQYDGDGKPAHSWRYHLQPAIDSAPVPWVEPDADSSWEDGAFADWRAWSQPDLCEKDSTTTHMFTPIGPDTALGDTESDKLDDIDVDQILLLYAPAMSGHWMEPLDFSVDDIDLSEDESTKSIFGSPLYVGFADGRVWRLSDNTPLNAVYMFLTRNGGIVADRELLLKPHRID